MTQDQAGLRVHGTKTTWFASETKIREDRTVTVHMLADALHINKLTCDQILREDLGKRISRLFKQLRRWSSQTFRKRHSPAAFRTCRNAGNSVLTAEGTTSKGTGNISCEVEFCIFHRLSLRTLRTKDVILL
jgi:shikimate kinase